MNRLAGSAYVRVRPPPMIIWFILEEFIFLDKILQFELLMLRRFLLLGKIGLKVTFRTLAQFIG